MIVKAGRSVFYLIAIVGFMNKIPILEILKLHNDINRLRIPRVIYISPQFSIRLSLRALIKFHWTEYEQN